MIDSQLNTNGVPVSYSLHDDERLIIMQKAIKRRAFNGFSQGD